MKKSVEILGLPIISITEGRELGVSKSLLIDTKNGLVAAITIEDDDWYRGVKLIPYESVIAIGADAVTITHSENILKLEDAGDYEALLDENIRVIGTKAITKNGMIQGTVTEICVGDDGRIEKCEVTAPDGTTMEVTADQISIFGKQVTVIDAELEKKTELIAADEPDDYAPTGVDGFTGAENQTAVAPAVEETSPLEPETAAVSYSETMPVATLVEEHEPESTELESVMEPEPVAEDVQPIAPALESTAVEPPIEEPAAEQPIEQPTSEPIIPPTVEEPVLESTMIEPPIEEPAVEQPIEQPTSEPVIPPTVEEPVLESTMIETPIEEPAVEQPIDLPTSEPVIPPTVEEPVLESTMIEPPIEEPAVEQPIEQPTSEPVIPPTVEEPALEPSMIETPIEEPAVEQPIEQPTSEPVIPPTVEEPALEQPTIETPIGEPAVEQPIDLPTNEPALPPTVEEPVLEQPTAVETPSELPSDEGETLEQRTRHKTQQAELLRAALRKAMAKQAKTKAATEPEAAATAAMGLQNRRSIFIGKHASKTIKTDNGITIVEEGAEITEAVFQKARLANKLTELSQSIQ